MLKNKVSIITGSNRGIGKKTLEIFAINKAEIIACSRIKNESHTKYLENLSLKYKVNIHEVFFDLSNQEEIKNAYEEINKKFDHIDILVNNAADIHVALFQMTPLKKFRDIFETNFFSHVYFTQLVLKKMIKSNCGSIINLSSSAAIDGNEGRSAYAGSKAALIAFSKVISREFSRYKIRVNCIAPGLTDTDMMNESTPEESIKKVIDENSSKRIANPEEIANLIAFLGSEKSSYINGQTIRIDGGM